MNIRIYDYLPKEAVKIRKAVFVEEQGFHSEFDRTDETAVHMVLFDEDQPVGVCRFFSSDSGNEFFIGRIAIVKEYRGQNLGTLLLEYAEKEIKKLGGNSVLLHAQCKAEKFYQKQGYASFGKTDLDENCPHIWMRKTIRANR